MKAARLQHRKLCCSRAALFVCYLLSKFCVFVALASSITDCNSIIAFSCILLLSRLFCVNITYIQFRWIIGIIGTHRKISSAGAKFNQIRFILSNPIVTTLICLNKSYAYSCTVTIKSHRHIDGKIFLVNFVYNGTMN